MLKNLQYLSLIIIFFFVYHNNSFSNTNKPSDKTEVIKELFTQKKYRKALSELHKLALNGDLDASLLLAELYFKGKIVKRDVSLASKYLFKGVKVGHSKSAHNLLKIISKHANKVTESELNLILEISEKEFPESTKDIKLQISKKGIVVKEKTEPPKQNLPDNEQPESIEQPKGNDDKQDKIEEPKINIPEPEIKKENKPKKDQILTKKGWNNDQVYWNDNIDIVSILNRGGGGSGSGFAINPNGIIISNEHVIDGCNKITVIYQGNHTARAKVLYKNKSQDLSILKINYKTPQFLSLSSYEPPLGSEIIVGGFPDIYSFGLNLKINSGVISGKASSPNPYFRKTDFNTYFDQIDAPIQPGNSGSPVVNRYGDIVGVAAATAKADLFDYLPQNINWMVNFNTLREYLYKNNVKFYSYNYKNNVEFEDIARQLQKSAVTILCEF